VRQSGDVTEHKLPSSQLHDYRDAVYRAQLGSLLKQAVIA
jgi:hypothetical protein